MNRRWIRPVVLCAAALLTTGTAWCFDRDTTRKIVTVSPQGSPALTVSDLREAAKFLAANASPANPWTWQFRPGDYRVNATIMVPNGAGSLKGVSLKSNPAAPARIIREAVWDVSRSPEPLLLLRFCRNISIDGFEFHGVTVDHPETPDWNVQGMDQGVELTSCDTASVTRNKFFNFGNAALRVATDRGDPVRGVNSFRTTVSGNLFDNIHQISTTTTDQLHGGTAHYKLTNNVFRRLQGSIKFATRTEGATDVAIVNNVVESSSRFAVEIVNYQQVKISGNVLQNIALQAINMYTDGDPQRMAHGFPWGDNFTITGNVIRNAGEGIRYVHNAFWDGTQNVPRNLVISDNTFDGIQAPSAPAIIYVAGIRVDGLDISNNRRHAASRKPDIVYPADSTGVKRAGNVTLAARPVHDLDSNLKSQVVWQQPSNGQLIQWPGPSVWSPNPLVIPAGWTVLAMADVDGDRRADAVLTNAATGQVAVLATGRPSVTSLLGTLDATWRLAAVGDLNGDGKADLVWRRAGETFAWYLNQHADGNTVVTSRAPFPMDAAWQLIAAADFDGDGKADLLWRQPNTANTEVWLIDGTVLKARRPLQIDAASYMVATGDFDGDGKSEILMRNPTNGVLTFVYGAATSSPRMDPPLAGLDPQTWRTGTIGDFNGDGCSDIAWRNASTGQVVIWMMRGSAMQSSTPVPSVDGSWTLIR